LLRWFFLVDNTALPTIDFVNVLAPYATSRSVEVRHSFADQCLSQRDAVRDGIALMALRTRATSNVREFRLAIDSAAGPELYRAADLQRLSWDVFYTDLICTELARGEYRRLLQTLQDLVNPGPPQFPQFAFPVQNIALFNMLRRWENHFVAMERVISLVGTERQKADARRYMETRKVFMDNFPVTQQPPPPPAPPVAFLAAIQQSIQSIATSLGAVAVSFQDLVTTVESIAATIEDIGVPQLLGTVEDDEAVAATNIMAAQGLLAFLPAVYKSELIKRILGGGDLIPAVVDEEEDAILTILRDTKTRSPAEFLQLAASASWEILDSSFDGTQRDQLVALFKF
jgi:hypothetical protein